MTVAEKRAKVAANTIVYQSFLEVLTFALVFRTTSCYARYWESLSMLENLSAKLMSCLTESLSFDMVAAHQRRHLLVASAEAWG